MNLKILAAIAVPCALSVVRPAWAAHFTTLKMFSVEPQHLPAPLTRADDGAFYTTSRDGGSNGFGMVFRVTTNGLMTPLWSFTGGLDGGYPLAGLVQATNGALYGTTAYGGSNGYGTIYRITTNGVFTRQYSFPVGNAYDPVTSPLEGELVRGDDGALYGTKGGLAYRYSLGGTYTQFTTHALGLGDNGLTKGNDGSFYGGNTDGGSNGQGSIFRMTTNGIVTILYSFNGAGDGHGPSSRLLLGTDGVLYGTTSGGGDNGEGTVFKCTTNGLFTTIYSAFDISNQEPEVGLTQASDGALYGTHKTGGGLGAVYRITTNGVYSLVYSFDGAAAHPVGELVEVGDALYGTTYHDGYFANGTVYRITTGGAYTSLWKATYGSQGARPLAGLALGLDGQLYGTTSEGGPEGGHGTVYRITTGGSFSQLWVFPFYTVASPYGYAPAAKLLQGADGHFYTTTRAGSTYDAGEFFQISGAGDYQGIHTFATSYFDPNNSAMPVGDLAHGPDGSLFGVTSVGGTYNYGTIYRINASNEYSQVWSFNQADGAFPQGITRDIDGGWYGTTANGGSSDAGTVFRLTTNGSLITLHSFTGGQDGYSPAAGLTRAADGAFYGTTLGRGSNGVGTIFRMSTNGTFTTIWHFGSITNGVSPDAPLVVGDDGALYGTTSTGGTNDLGTIYRITTNGVFTTLWSFTGGAGGAKPFGGLCRIGSTFFGTTSEGPGGTVFKFSLDGVPVPTGYGAWASLITNGKTNYGESAGGDGYPNLLKYATGSSPQVPDERAHLDASLVGGALTLHFHRNTNAVDTAIIVERSPSLATNATWTGLATNTAGSWGSSTGMVSETGSGFWVEAAMTLPAQSATNSFHRLRVRLN